MSTRVLPASGLISLHDALGISLGLAVVYVAYIVSAAVYDVYFGALSKFPGPKLRALSAVPQLFAIFMGDDATATSALHKTYGDVVRVTPNELSFVSPQAWKDIYGFRKAGQPTLEKPKKFYIKPANGIDGIITADDAGHTRQRKIISHAFSDKALREQEPLLNTWANNLCGALMKRAKAGEKVDLLAYFNYTTFDVMGTLIFNEDLGMLEGSDYSPWLKIIYGSIKLGTKLRAIRYFVGTDKLLKALVPKSANEKRVEHFKYSSDRVDKRLAFTPDSPDLWSRIIDASEKGDQGLTLGEQHSIASTFMVAGTETTATALSGTTFHLLSNLETYDKVVKEIRETYSTTEEMTLDSLVNLKYLNAVLQEGLRMYPPVPIGLPRLVPAGGAIIAGNVVPAGTTISVPQYATYSYENNFKHADKFVPERWLGDPEYENDHRDAWAPFSTGPRNCIGKNLALLEMKLLLAVLLWNFDLSLRSESEDWSNQKVYTLWEKKALMVDLKPIR